MCYGDEFSISISNRALSFFVPLKCDDQLYFNIGTEKWHIQREKALPDVFDKQSDKEWKKLCEDLPKLV